jgi:hypothetical protein
VADAEGQPGGRWSAPRWHYPEYPPGSVIEIRVHGVGGEPPSSMTRDPDPVLVGGDELAGFHRARNPVVDTVDREDAGTGQPPPGHGGPTTNGDPPRASRRRRSLHVREVLAWGGQTSGTVRHALWVLLLPFALFNVAGRMHVTGSATRARRQRAACRVLALTMTLSVVALTCGIAFDLIAVQCGARAEACLGGSGSGPFLLAPFRRFGDDVIGRFGVAALVPVLVIVALWYSGRYGTRRLEGQRVPGTASSDPAATEPTSMADRDFWRNAWPASRLRGLHATAGFAWIGGTLALSSHLVVLDVAGPDAEVGGAWLVLAGVAAVTVLGCVVLVARPATAVPGRDRRVHLAVTVLRALGLGSLGLGVGRPSSAGCSCRRRFRPHGPRAPAVADPVRRRGGHRARVVGRRDPWLAPPPRMGTRRPPSSPARRRPRTSASRPRTPGWRSDRSCSELRGPRGPRRRSCAMPTRRRPPRDWLACPSSCTAARGCSRACSRGRTSPSSAWSALQMSLVVALGLLAAWRPGPAELREDRSPLDQGSPVPRDLTPVAVALLSLLLVTAVGAGLHALVGDALGSTWPRPSSTRPRTASHSWPRGGTG